MVEHARRLGWHDVDVIDDDLGVSGSGTCSRPGFERLLNALCKGRVGAVFSIEASRLARNGRDWHSLLAFCSVVGALLIDAEALYDPRLTTDRLLLGMKGMISEMEVASFRERAHAALLQRAIDCDVYRSNQTMIANDDNARGRTVRGGLSKVRRLSLGCCDAVIAVQRYLLSILAPR